MDVENYRLSTANHNASTRSALYRAKEVSITWKPFTPKVVAVFILSAMQLKTSVKLEGFKQEWIEGKDLVDVSVTLGHNEMSSNCTVTVEDIGNLKAASLVKHSLTTGGIVSLTATPNTANEVNTASANFEGSVGDRGDWEKAIVGECLRQGVKDRHQIAYILGTADHESSMGQYLVELASGDAYQGRLGNNNPGDGRKYKGRGLVQVTGKVNYQKWSKLLGVDFVANPDLIKQPKYALTTLVVGMRDGVFTGQRLGSFVGGGKQDYTGARSTVNGFVAEQVASVNAKTAKYLQVVDKLMQGQGVATASLPTDKEKPTPTQTGNGVNGQTVNPETVAPVDETIKGNRIVVTIGESEFTFYHQGTETGYKGLTTVRGQGVRWIMNRRKRNTTLENISLKSLAVKVATAYELKLDWQAPNDPKYGFLDATWLTDYELLLRECKQAGLFLGEANGVLTVKPLGAIRDTTFVIQEGLNLIQWTVKDVAVDKNSPDVGSSLLQGENKVELDPVSGQFVAVRPDIDSKPDKDTTGKDKKAVKGVMAPEDKAITDMARSRVKRVKGLPSTFVVELTQDSLDLKPLDAVRTVGLSGIFSRVWMVDSVTHSVLSGTTTLGCFSPVEVIDDRPQQVSGSSGNGLAGNGQLVAPLTGNGLFTPPVRGYVVTSPRGWRWGRMHHGYDLGTPVGVPCQASMGGVVTVAGNQRGYGLVVYIKHDNGYETRYAHLSSIGVRVGQMVKQAEVIGKTGNTGLGTGAHIHWEIRLNGNSQQSEATNIGRLTKGMILN